MAKKGHGLKAPFFAVLSLICIAANWWDFLSMDNYFHWCWIVLAVISTLLHHFFLIFHVDERRKKSFREFNLQHAHIAWPCYALPITIFIMYVLMTEWVHGFPIIENFNQTIVVIGPEAEFPPLIHYLTGLLLVAVVYYCDLESHYYISDAEAKRHPDKAKLRKTLEATGKEALWFLVDACQLLVFVMDPSIPGSRAPFVLWSVILASAINIVAHPSCSFFKISVQYCQGHKQFSKKFMEYQLDRLVKFLCVCVALQGCPFALRCYLLSGQRLPIFMSVVNFLMMLYNAFKLFVGVKEFFMFLFECLKK